MRVAKGVLFGLVGLFSSVDASTVTPKPVLAKRQTAVTVTNDGCTAICWNLPGLSEDWTGTDCDVYCSGGFSTNIPATSTSTSISTSTAISTVTSSAKAALNQRTVVSTTNGDCNAICSMSDEGDYDCDFGCSPDGVPATKAALNQRTVVSATNGDCTAICWDLMPGTECDVQCSSDFKTKMPVPSKAPRVANIGARENVQAHQVREARLARKFGGLAARDHTTVFITSTPVDCSTITSTITGIPNIHPMQMGPYAPSPEASAVLSKAHAALSLAQQAQVGTAAAIPSAASSALSEASASLSSAVATAPIWANATTATPGSTGFVFTVSATTTATSPAFVLTVSAKATATSTSSETTATSTSSETTTTSTTTTGSLVVSVAGTTISTSFPATGAAPEYTVSTGLVLCFLIGLAANVAFLI